MTSDEALAALLALPAGASALLVGESDTGKTTLTLSAVRALGEAGKTVAVVDADLGQSEIGPPGTVGAALSVPGEIPRALRDLKPLGAAFVGAISPARQGMDLCLAACQMARAAKLAKPDLLLIDTGGLIPGPSGRSLVRALYELLLPRVVIGLARGGELDGLWETFRGLRLPERWAVQTPQEAGRKTPASRATRRAARFGLALEGAVPQTWPLDAVGLRGTVLGFGEPLPHHVRQFLADSLRAPVPFAERDAQGVSAIVNGDRWDARGVATLETHFRTRSIRLISAAHYQSLLVGLTADSGLLLDIGLLESLDCDRREVTVLTACKRPAAVAQVRLGTVRIRPDGREIAVLKPGDV